MRKLFIVLLLVLITAMAVGCAEQDAEIPDAQFTSTTLAEYDGRDGHPAYIAVDGLVYDVSNHNSWTNGEHHGFNAGIDISDYFHENHKEAKLKALPIMGTYTD